MNAVASGADIIVQFGSGDASLKHNVTVQAQDADLDICLLRLPIEHPFEPLVISTRRLRGGEKWSAFGYAVHKLNLGHLLNGGIQQALDELVHGVDLEVDTIASSDGVRKMCCPDGYRMLSIRTEG